MAGTYNKGNPPKRPGAYFNFVAQTPATPIVGSIGTVGLVATHSWGPVNQVVTLNDWGDFLSVYSDGGAVTGNVTNAYRTVRDAFRGEGIPGYAGAGTVLFYRVANAAVAASKALSNGASNAITLTAVYPGSYGNNLAFTVVANQGDPVNLADLVIYVKGSEVERFTYAKANITDLGAQLNGTAPYTATTKSDWVVASAITSGTALTAVTQVAATGGTDGSALTPTDFANAQTAFNSQRFSVFAIDSQVDPTILAAQVTWAQGLNGKGKRFVSVVGGAAAETMGTAVARAASIQDPNFVNVGGGTYSDQDYGSLGTSQLVGRIAGIIAQRGEGAEITFARLAGLTITQGVTDADILNALAGGTVAISRDSHPTAPVRLELGVTTWTSTTDVNRAQPIFGNLKFVRVMGGIETEITEWAEQNVIGKMAVTQATRDYIRGQIAARLTTREINQIIQPGWTVQVSQNPPPQPTDTFVSLDYAVTLARGLEQVLSNVTVG